jgi:hypothetical protein
VGARHRAGRAHARLGRGGWRDADVGARGRAARGRLRNPRRDGRVRVQGRARPALPPPSRTDWTRLVPPSVLTGHVSPRPAPSLGVKRDATRWSGPDPPRPLPRDTLTRDTPGGILGHGAQVRPPPLPRTKWTRRVPHPVLIGHAASLSQGRSALPGHVALAGRPARAGKSGGRGATARHGAVPPCTRCLYDERGRD